MKTVDDRLVRLAAGAAFLLAVGAAALLARPADPPQAGSAPPVAVADDWTHRHVVFSRQAIGESDDRLEADPRYVRQRLALGRRLPLNARAPEPPPAAAPTACPWPAGNPRCRG